MTNHFIAALAVFVGGTALSGAAAVELFGLTHTSLGNASLTLYSQGGLWITDVSTNGLDGVSTHLGEAESGVFIFPNASYLAPGNVMRAEVFGTVNDQTNSRIGTVNGSYPDYGIADVTANFSFLGATSLTFQAWGPDSIVGERTVSSGFARILQGGPPRVNPWIALDGTFGALVDFGRRVQVTLPGCSDCPALDATRMFLRPNGATSIVNSVSRTDVYAGGWLRDFFYDSVRLGMFGNSHEALGAVKFVATNRVLTVVNTNEPGTNGSFAPPSDLSGEIGPGFLVEFEHATTAAVQLLPVDIAVTNANQMQEQLVVSVSGIRNNYLSQIGKAFLANSNGALTFAAAVDSGPNHLLLIYSNDVFVASNEIVSLTPIPVTGGPRLIATSANAELAAAPSTIALTFDRPATFQLPQGSGFAVGNRALVRSTDPAGVASIQGVAVIFQVIPSVTVIAESATYLRPALTISRAQNSITLRWADPARSYWLEEKHDLLDPWENSPTPQSPPVYEKEFVSVTYPIGTGADLRFYRLLLPDAND
jgi:hypothetical protein